MSNSEDKTHFGFQTVSSEEKASRVRNVFTNVAQKYDVMNDCMSLGLHRIWKDYTVARMGICDCIVFPDTMQARLYSRTYGNLR